MFSGFGPFSILISKIKSCVKVISIDKNPYAIKLLKYNKLINNVYNLEILNIDSNEIKNLYKNYADNIIMNLPYDSKNFIESALISCKKNGLIHYYSMEYYKKLNSKNVNILFFETIKFIKSKALKLNKKIEIENKFIIRSCSAHNYNIRIDIKVLN